jgi:hypothetical protein
MGVIHLLQLKVCCKQTAIYAGLVEMHRGEGLLFHWQRSYAMQKGTPP